MYWYIAYLSSISAPITYTYCSEVEWYVSALSFIVHKSLCCYSFDDSKSVPQRNADENLFASIFEIFIHWQKHFV